MPLPSDMDTVTVTGTYVGVDGSPAQGSVTFTAVTRLRSAATHTSILPSRVVGTLDGSGHLSVQIPATDDPDITPPGWVWQVEENLGSSSGPIYQRAYTMLAPTGQDIDLTNVQPAEPPGPPPVNSIVTIAGNGPNAEGDVPVYLAKLSDTAINAPTAGQLLTWTGTAWANSPPPAGAGDLVAANNLSDLASISTARTNIGLHGAALLDVGTSSGTVAAGDDSRITITQDTSVGNAALGTRLSTQETLRNTFGRWYSTSNNTTATKITAETGLSSWAVVGDPPSGITVAGDTFTVANTGRYLLAAQMFGNVQGTAVKGYVALTIKNVAGTIIYAYQMCYFDNAAGTATTSAVLVNCTVPGPVKLAAGDTIKVNVYCNNSNAGVVMAGDGTNLATTFGIQRVG